MSGETTPNKELQEVFDDILPHLDTSYSERGLQIAQRPLRAATFVVEHLVVKIQGGDKKDYFESEWFAAFYHCAERWYRARYGDFKELADDRHMIGAVPIYSQWFKVEVPTTSYKPDSSDHQFWVKFPNAIEADESPIEWISKGVRVENMTESMRQKTRKRISHVATQLRKINLNLLTEYDNDQQRNRANHVVSHLQNTATELARNTPHGAQLAMWEIFLAVELTLKLWLSQRGHSYPDSHDLLSLKSIIESERGGAILDDDLLSRFMSGSEAISFRYGEGSPPNLNRQRNLYEIGLTCIEIFSSDLKRKLSFSGGSFKFQRPPWARMLDEYE